MPEFAYVFAVCVLLAVCAGVFRIVLRRQSGPVYWPTIVTCLAALNLLPACVFPLGVLLGVGETLLVTGVIGSMLFVAGLTVWNAQDLNRMRDT